MYPVETLARHGIPNIHAIAGRGRRSHGNGIGSGIGSGIGNGVHVLGCSRICSLRQRVSNATDFNLRLRRLGDSLIAPQPNQRLSLVSSRLIARGAASHGESEDIEVEKVQNEFGKQAAESEEAWRKALESFKMNAVKMQGMSQEAYEAYSKKAMAILKSISEQLKVQADIASKEMASIAEEIKQEGTEYISAAVENPPEPVRDIVETFSSSSVEFKDISTVYDFYVGIPYGLFLSLCGFLSFMLTGSTAAIRFGMIFGVAILTLSVLSLRAWRKGESSPLLLKGQAGIAFVLFIRQMRLLYERASLATSFWALIRWGSIDPTNLLVELLEIP